MFTTFEPAYITYAQWIERYPDIQKEIEECPGCDGSGDTECPCCGSQMECEDCGGAGEVDESAREKYRKQLARDKVLVEKFNAAL